MFNYTTLERKRGSNLDKKKPRRKIELEGIAKDEVQGEEPKVEFK